MVSRSNLTHNTDQIYKRQPSIQTNELFLRNPIYLTDAEVCARFGRAVIGSSKKVLKKNYYEFHEYDKNLQFYVSSTIGQLSTKYLENVDLKKAKKYLEEKFSSLGESFSMTKADFEAYVKPISTLLINLAAGSATVALRCSPSATIAIMSAAQCISEISMNMISKGCDKEKVSMRQDLEEIKNVARIALMSYSDRKGGTWYLYLLYLSRYLYLITMNIFVDDGIIFDEEKLFYHSLMLQSLLRKHLLENMSNSKQQLSSDALKALESKLHDLNGSELEYMVKDSIDMLLRDYEQPLSDVEREESLKLTSQKLHFANNINNLTVTVLRLMKKDDHAYVIII